MPAGVVNFGFDSESGQSVVYAGFLNGGSFSDVTS